MTMEDAQKLLGEQKYVQAAKMLDRLLITEKNSSELFYLRGITSMKLRKYDSAQEYWERALFVERKSKYYKIKGMAYLEIFDVDNAVESFNSALKIEPDDVETNFFMSIAYMLMDDHQSAKYMKKAKQLNERKTKRLAFNFYTLFLKNDPTITSAQKSEILERIENISRR
ncbi:hypothetical protein KKF81_05800 [Candidatus Micrarchaeota archaeon]|nr:hypothetical protein [Candidatus Micrarchaeota archaeon]MBU1166443.1 hypothetical protein [Candidatus Micrarchaeota archaeon]MBU1886550.1 hypothetical protein [Candidatus Micrarchaeota archaeon]